MIYKAPKSEWTESGLKWMNMTIFQPKNNLKFKTFEAKRLLKQSDDF